MKKTLLAVLLAATGIFGAERFDHLVRNDFFAGFSGDTDALARAMKTTEDLLEQNPKHPEALVWHGSGLFFQSGQSFRAGDMAKGQELWARGMKEMDEGVALAPDSIATRAPRGGLMISVSRAVPEGMRAELLKRGLADYVRIFEMQKDTLAQLPTHPKGELLLGLADLHDRSGNREQSLELVRRVAAEMPATVYGKRAQQWLDTGALPAEQRSCLGCHTAGAK